MRGYGQMASAVQLVATPQKRGRGGRRKSAEHLRCERVTITMYPADLKDLEVLARAWDVSLSTLAWSVVHGWLQGERGESADLGEMREPLRMALEAGLRDKELGPWLRGLIKVEGER